MNNTEQTVDSKTVETVIKEHQEHWKMEVEELSNKLKKLPDVLDLQTVVYSKRQDCLTYYYSLLNKISAFSKTYKAEYAQKYNYYKTQAQIRYQSDSAINAQIDADLADFTYQIELLNSLAKYMQDTIRTIDDIIYGINNRIKVEELVQSYGK